MLCKVDGCGSHANRVGAQLCEAHYMRVMRHGSTDKKTNIKDGDLVHCGGYYLLAYAPSHPLANGPRVYAHRMAYYDAYGKGPFLCFHCQKVVTWADMHIDHLDDNPQNNSIDNLVASCPICNQKRGRHKMKKAMQEKGLMIEFSGERLHVSEWADRLGIDRRSLRLRLKTWPIEKALTEPRGKTGPKSIIKPSLE